MRLRIFIVASVILIQVIGAASQSKAESGWAWRNKTWVQYSFTFTHPQALKGKGLVVLRQTQRQEAVRLAVMDWRAYEKQLRVLLRRAQATLSLARSIVSGFPASCVANEEEGGHNSVAGYFGTIYAPSAYGGVAVQLAVTYGESWLNWPWSAQLQVALDLFSRYGGSAWGVTTRMKCGI